MRLCGARAREFPVRKTKIGCARNRVILALFSGERK